MDKTAQGSSASVGNTNQQSSASSNSNITQSDPGALGPNAQVSTAVIKPNTNTDKNQEQVSISHGKEAEPVVPKEPEAAPPDNEQYEIPKQVEAHVEMAQEKIEIPQELKKHGVEHPAHEQSPKFDVTKSHPPLPLTDNQIGQALGQKQTSSIRWLAEWCVKQLKVLHIHLKEVHGRFIEVKDK